MKRTASCLLGIVFCATLAGGQRSVPLGDEVTNPGIGVKGPRITDELLNVPPSEHQRAQETAQLKRDAATLAQLAETVPGDIDQTQKGVLPKDLLDKLKRIEKLSRQIRRRLSP